MKKMTHSLLSVLLVSAVFSGCGNNADSTYSETQETYQETYTYATTSAPKNYAENKNCKLEFGDATLTKTDNGKDVLIVDVTFTNNSGSSTSCYDVFELRAFQDGIQCDYAFILGESKMRFGSDDTFNEIKSGYSVTVQQAFELRNSSSDVEIGVYTPIYGDTSLYEQVYRI